MTQPDERPDRAACPECMALLRYDRRHPRGHPQVCPFCGNPELLYNSDAPTGTYRRCSTCSGDGWVYDDKEREP